jgi:2-polyprenyl-6-methoxyphenol hydroxylase-like FAD-dependent oxidoreductase
MIGAAAKVAAPVTSDVLVVGASIGGSMLAERMASLGRVVTMIDSHAAPIAGRRFGVPPATLDLWSHTGMLDDFQRRFTGLAMDTYVDFGSGVPKSHATPAYQATPELAASGDHGHLLRSLRGEDPRGGAVACIGDLPSRLPELAQAKGATLATETSFTGAKLAEDGMWEVAVQARDGATQLHRTKSLVFADGGKVSREFVDAAVERRGAHTYYVGGQFDSPPPPDGAGATRLAKRVIPQAGNDRVLFAHTDPRVGDARRGTTAWLEVPRPWADEAGPGNRAALLDAHGDELRALVDEQAPLLGLDPARLHGDPVVVPIVGEVATRAAGTADQPGVFLLGDALGTGDIAGGSFGNAAMYDAVNLAPRLDAWIGAAGPVQRQGLQEAWNVAATDARRAVVDLSLERLHRSSLPGA